MPKVNLSIAQIREPRDDTDVSQEIRDLMTAAVSAFEELQLPWQAVAGADGDYELRVGGYVLIFPEMNEFQARTIREAPRALNKLRQLLPALSENPTQQAQVEDILRDAGWID